MTLKKRGPSLYEVLKDTLRKREQERQQLAAGIPAEPVTEPEAVETPAPAAETAAPIEIPPEPEMTEPPAPAFAEAPAGRPEFAPEPVAVSAPEPEPAPEPDPLPPVLPPPIAPTPVVRRWRGLGERTVVMTYNTAAFGGLVLLLTIVAAYSAGLSRGRTETETVTPESIPTVTPAPAPPAPAPAPAPQWRIRVYAWEVPSTDPAHHRTAAPLRKQLEQAGFRDLKVETVPTPNGRFAAVLTAGAFVERTSPEAQEVFRRLSAQIYRGTPLGRQLAFVRFSSAFD